MQGSSRTALSAARQVLNGTLSFHLSPLGDLLALAAALMWAVYSILVKKYTERYDNFLVTRRVFLWAFLTSLPLVLLTDGLPSLTPLFTQPNILISWLFLGVFGNAVCFAIWNIAFKRLGVVVTFMAILELVKESLIELVQNEPFAAIHVRLRPAPVEERRRRRGPPSRCPHRRSRPAHHGSAVAPPLPAAFRRDSGCAV